MPNLFRVDVEVFARVDCNDGRTSISLYQVVDISLSQSVKHRALIQISDEKLIRGWYSFNILGKINTLIVQGLPAYQMMED